MTIRGPYYGKSAILVVISMIGLLIVHMLNIYFLASSMGFIAYMVHVSKTFTFLTSCAPSKFVPKPLQNVVCELLMALNLNKEMGLNLVFLPLH
jgi:hypothetical protein